jgi:endonuclease/exonuclease/phosphatase family metal-dependent hydrolase
MPHEAGKIALCLGASLLTVLVAATRVEATDPCVAMPVTRGAAPASVQPPAPDSFTIASLNVAGGARVGDVLVVWARERALDVLMLQEVGDRSHDGAAFVAALGDRLGFHFAYAPADRLGDAETKGLAILSRHRLEDVRIYPLKYHRLRFRSRCRIALAASLITANGPVRLVNVHLDTRINSQDRLAQLAPLVDALDPVDAPQIIGGDFNTMDIRWVRTMWPFPYLQRQASAVRARLGIHGFQTPFTSGRPTFRFLGLPLRLDWLYLKRLEAVDWNVDTVRFTDHRGVWVRVKQ